MERYLAVAAFATFALMGCALESPGSGGEAEIRASSSWSSETTLAEVDGVEATSKGFWHLDTRESCYDLIGASCYSRQFTPGCPASPDGQRCWPAGNYCWLVVSTSRVDGYICR